MITKRWQLQLKQSTLVSSARLVVLLLATIFFLYANTVVFAQECPANSVCIGGCRSADQCVDGVRCEQYRAGETWYLAPGRRPCGGGVGEAILGGIDRPSGLKSYSFASGSFAKIGIINFLSLLLRIFTIICGLWFMFNVIFAGILFISSSTDTATFGKVRESLLYSLIGLFVLAIAYMVAGLIGTIFFGDAGFILNPTLIQAGTTP